MSSDPITQQQPPSCPLIDCVNCWGNGMVVVETPAPRTQWDAPPVKRHRKCAGCNGTGKVVDPRV